MDSKFFRIEVLIAHGFADHDGTTKEFRSKMDPNFELKRKVVDLGLQDGVLRADGSRRGRDSNRFDIILIQD